VRWLVCSARGPRPLLLLLLPLTHLWWLISSSVHDGCLLGLEQQHLQLIIGLVPRCCGLLPLPLPPTPRGHHGVCVLLLLQVRQGACRMAARAAAGWEHGACAACVRACANMHKLLRGVWCVAV
jgi:hypothetical protein